MRCLEKDKPRRYDTVAGLTKDLQRHLADEQVEARPVSPWYRLRKTCRSGYRRARSRSSRIHLSSGSGMDGGGGDPA